jgi:hypothetical protein
MSQKHILGIGTQFRYGSLSLHVTRIRKSGVTFAATEPAEDGRPPRSWQFSLTLPETENAVLGK